MPVEVGINLSRRDQMFQLLQPGKPPKQKHFPGHSHSLEDSMKLACSKFGRPATLELGKVTADLAEGGAIAAIIAAGRAKSDRAAVKDLPNDCGDFADAVVLFVVTDIEDLVMHGFLRRLEGKGNCLADVLDMDQRPPGRSIARHPDLLGRPSEP